MELTKQYLLELSSVAMRVQDLDESYAFGQSKTDIYEKVLSLDKDIRSLKSSTPRTWWNEYNATFSGDHLVQFWHYYLLVRTHVHSAMSNDDHDQYSYSRSICTDACHNLAQRYGYVRQNLPPGFFVCRIIDMQIFSAAIFLILSCYGHSVTPNSRNISLTAEQEEQQLASVQYILKTMESVSGQVSSEFAKEAAGAIRSLLSLLGNPAAAQSHGLTLRIPLLGKVHIAAKQQILTQQQPQQQTTFEPSHPAMFNVSHANTSSSTGGPPMPTANEPSNNTADAFPWFMGMELDMNSSSLQDPFITNEFGDWNQWMGDGISSFMF